MRQDQIDNLQRWANRNCALNAMFGNSTGTKIVMIGLRDQARTAASFSRTLRGIFRRYAIDETALKGKWLHLLSSNEALKLILHSDDFALEKTSRSNDAPQDDNAKVVTLR